MISNILELEYKYNAADIGLEAFQKLIATLGPSTNLVTASWDIYYLNPKNPETIVRLRLSDTKPELTKKTKTVSGNNFRRLEYDLPLDVARLDQNLIKDYLASEGYEENFRIYKACDIYFLNNTNYVYYIVLDKNWKEQGRFIEVEVNKDRVNYLGVEAQAILDSAESALSSLGITYKNRIRKSLFEFFREVG